MLEKNALAAPPEMSRPILKIPASARGRAPTDDRSLGSDVRLATGEPSGPTCIVAREVVKRLCGDGSEPGFTISVCPHWDGKDVGMMRERADRLLGGGAHMGERCRACERMYAPTAYSGSISAYACGLLWPYAQ